MSASTSIIQQTGSSGSPTTTTITNLRFASADSPNSGTTNPISVPTTGSVTSYWTTVYLTATTAPTTGIVNVQFYMNTSNPWSGVTLQVGTASSYTQAVGTGGIGTALNSTNYPGLTGLGDGFSYTSSAPLTLPGSIGATTGKIGNFLVLQLTVSSTASAGTLTGAQAYIQYDES